MTSLDFPHAARGILPSAACISASRDLLPSPATLLRLAAPRVLSSDRFWLSTQSEETEQLLVFTLGELLHRALAGLLQNACGDLLF
jgi:hypothetical protein